MALKYTKRVKFAYDYDWVEDDLSLPNIVISLQEQAKVLQQCKPKIWDTLISQYGVDPFEVPFVQVPVSSDLYKWQPWFSDKLRSYLPPLCDGSLNDEQFSFKWTPLDDPEGTYLEYLDINVNAFEFATVQNFYVMQTNVRREYLGGDKVEYVTKHRVLQYTSNY